MTDAFLAEVEGVTLHLAVVEQKEQNKTMFWSSEVSSSSNNDMITVTMTTIEH